MLRIIVQTDDANMAAHVGGNVHTTHRTFDVELPELEAFLSNTDTYAQRRVIGVEVAPQNPGGMNTVTGEHCEGSK